MTRRQLALVVAAILIFPAGNLVLSRRAHRAEQRAAVAERTIERIERIVTNVVEERRIRGETITTELVKEIAVQVIREQTSSSQPTSPPTGSRATASPRPSGRPPFFPTPTPRQPGVTPAPTPVSGALCSLVNCAEICRDLGLFCEPIQLTPLPPSPIARSSHA